MVVPNPYHGRNMGKDPPYCPPVGPSYILYSLPHIIQISIFHRLSFITSRSSLSLSMELATISETDIRRMSMSECRARFNPKGLHDDSDEILHRAIGLLVERWHTPVHQQAPLNDFITGPWRIALAEMSRRNLDRYIKWYLWRIHLSVERAKRAFLEGLEAGRVSSEIRRRRKEEEEALETLLKEEMKESDRVTRDLAGMERERDGEDEVVVGDKREWLKAVMKDTEC